MERFEEYLNETDEDSAATISPETVEIELRRIVLSRHFRSSKRSIQFLQYVVEQKLQGNESLIKERLIGIEVFGRKANYATGDDPVVRVQAGDVRRRLDAYHSEFADSLDLVIDLPTGSYVPVFRRRTAESATHDFKFAPQEEESFASPVEKSLAVPPPPSEMIRTPEIRQPDNLVERPMVLPPERDGRNRKPAVFMASGSLLLCLLVAGIYYVLHHQPNRGDAFSKFWDPVLLSSKPTIISLGKPYVYVPTGALFEKYSKDHPNTFKSPVDRHNKYLPLREDTPLQWGDLEPVTNSGPAVGGVRAGMQLASLFGRLGKPFLVRFGDESSFLELRESPAIIVGNMNNGWTNEIDEDLYFSIHDNNQEQWVTQTGTDKKWKREATSHGSTDYGLITRELVGSTGQFVVKIAGMSDAGTEAASELVTNADTLADVLKPLPSDWERKNVQLLIETDIINGKAGPPKLVATHVW